MSKLNERKYLAISIKHTIHRWKFGMPCTLWGHRTEDNEKRSYSGYTYLANEAELYSIEEFKKEYGCADIFKYDEPIHIDINLCKKYKKYDTVFIDAEEYINYCKVAHLAIGVVTSNTVNAINAELETKNPEITNYDYLKSCSIEDMANEFLNWFSNGVDCCSPRIDYNKQYDEILEWLKQKCEVTT